MVSGTRLMTLAGAACVIGVCTPAAARPQTSAHYDLPSQNLGAALRQVGQIAGVEIMFTPGDVARITAQSVRGNFTVAEALDRLLDGTGLTASYSNGAVVIRGRSSPPRMDVTDSADTNVDIVVTGTRIRGAPVASPVISIGQEQIRDAGQATLADVVRSLPQSFSGGQNPGVGNNVPAGNGVDVGGAASINLRGIGSDATLTLLNGHRLSYSASRQAIDVSSIPLGAIDRIEIVPDGASSLYGSDAVAGVANIILRRDFDGFETSARLGTSTDGGDFEQRYGVVAGRRWQSGGIIGTYEFGRTTQITGDDRSYTRDRPGLTLFPALKNHSALVSAHQRFGASVTASIDMLYNKRFSSSAYALNATGDILQRGARFDNTAESLVIAPTIDWKPGDEWRIFLTGSYGLDHTHYDVTNYSAGTPRVSAGNCYCNNAKSIELGGDGRIATLPGGPVKLALGGGYRSNKLVRFNGIDAPTNVSHAQASFYGYGEISLPLIGPAQSMQGIEALSFTGALRYEHYPHIGDVVTPKLGLIYSPNTDFALKGSWGKSFRAPTLYQQYQSRNVVLAGPDILGGVDYPSGATAIVLQGGNADLKPERATTWSVTLDVHPRRFAGSSLELSYFSIDYRDRIVTPITYLSQALSNPLYQDRLLPNPSASFLASIIASATEFGNATDGPYDPAAVAVFIDDSNINAGRQTIHGLDALLRYETRIGSSGDQLNATLDATYLESDQQLSSDQPIVQLAGTVFNPAHVRARGGLAWSDDTITLSTFVNYVGSVSDVRRTPKVAGSSLTTVDLAARFQTDAETGPLAGVDLVLSAQNLLNGKPPSIATTSFFDAPYDSTNYSAIGRFISVSVRKKW